MKKQLLMAALLGGVALSSGAALAMGDHHKGDYKGKMMERVDTNGDGMVSKSEYMAKNKMKFNKMDANGDGKLSKMEMKKAYKMKKDHMGKKHNMQNQYNES